MKKTVALLLAASLASAPAFAAELGETPLSAQGPVETPIAPPLPIASPLQTESLAQAAAAAIPPAQASAQAPVTAQASLTQTAAALDGNADAQTLTARFDGGTKLATGLVAAGLVLAATPAAPVLALSPALPAAYSAWRLAKTPASSRWSTPDRSRDWRGRAQNAASISGAVFAASFLMLIAHAALGGGPAFGVAAGLGALLIGDGAAGAVAHNRGEGVFRWQASHDQKYRHDPGTGQLKDIRGHKYGQLSDRFIEHVPGRLSGAELAALRLLGVGTALGLAALFGAPASTLLVINALAALGFAVTDALTQRDRP